MPGNGYAVQEDGQVELSGPATSLSGFSLAFCHAARITVHVRLKLRDSGELDVELAADFVETRINLGQRPVVGRRAQAGLRRTRSGKL